MLKIIISGSNGHMGQNVARLCKQYSDIDIVAGFDINGEQLSDFPVFPKASDFSGTADVVIDFSTANALTPLLDFCTNKKIPVVICTTGYSDAQKAEIKEAAGTIPVFMSANMSLGINLLASLIKKAAAILGEDFDVEIVEKHHNRKVDAPSGTALLLADALSEALPYESEYVYGRNSVRKPRDKHEIGISSVRGGTITGEHEIIFAGTDEVIEFKHTVYSRDVFGIGAIRAARFLSSCAKPGLYDMNDVISGI